MDFNQVHWFHLNWLVTQSFSAYKPLALFFVKLYEVYVLGIKIKAHIKQSLSPTDHPEPVHWASNAYWFLHIYILITQLSKVIAQRVLFQFSLIFDIIFYYMQPSTIVLIIIL